MGIFLNLYVSKNITADEWENAYLATLPLIDKFPLMEFKDSTPKGYPMHSGFKTVERELHQGLGWCTVGDYESYGIAEAYTLHRKISLQQKNEDFDPILLLGAEKSIITFTDTRVAGKYLSLWGDKTQGERYHIFLLAVACYMGNFLKDKLAIGGDVTRGQCKMAVDFIEDVLGEKIDLPIQCDHEKFYTRLRNLPLNQSEILDFFLTVYNGELTKEIASFVKKNFTDEEIFLYWKNRFSIYPADTIGFSKVLRDFLYLDFPVSDVAKYANNKTDDGKDLTETIIQKIMDSELHIKDKDCQDVLNIDKEAGGTYSIFSLLAGFVFSEAHNWRVDRYMPLEELRREIDIAFGNFVDTNSIIDNYLEEKRKIINENLSEVEPDRILKSKMDFYVDEKKSEEQKYDIHDYYQLRLFESGDTISPNVWKNTFSMFKFYLSANDENTLDELKNEGAESCIRFLCRQNRTIALMGDDWDKIFDKIKSNVENFNRYYPMVRVKITDERITHILRAFVLNDELWDFLNKSLNSR